MRKVGWFSAIDNNLCNNGLSRFVDSKFALDKKTSVVRELVQNSIDAKDNNNPKSNVEIEIDIQGIERNKVPGIDELIRRIELCKEKANIDARNEYESALKLLKKDKIYCLKVSDRNTTGVSADKDEEGNSQYRALLYDEGNSYGKQRGSAGSHGVGKRASFILSECNTVFYATKYKNSSKEDVCLCEGKYMLSTWVDNGKKMCGDGWFGILENDTVEAIENGQLYNIDDYFLRLEDYGTDVIAVGIDYENKEDKYKELYINSVLENFYVGIIDGKISIKVFGVLINADTIHQVYNEYYVGDKAAYLAGTNKCLLIGNLYDSKRVYMKATPDEIPIEVDGTKLGSILIYFDENNNKKKKYYSIIRDHGMKIRDYKLNTEKEFTAVVKIEGEALNEKLLDIENAAHDDFLTKNPESGIEYPEISTKALKEIQTKVEEYIIERTKIESANVQKIEGLNSVLNLPGKVSTAKIVNKEVKPVIPKPPKPPVPPNVRDKILFKEYVKWPRFMESDDGLIITFECARNIKKGSFYFTAVDFEGKEVKGMDNYNGTVVAMMDGILISKTGNRYDFKSIKKGRHIIEIKATELLPYKYALDVYENI